MAVLAERDDPRDEWRRAQEEAAAQEAEDDERRRNLNRNGRRSTILTGTGLTDIADENIDKKTLLGG